MRRLISILLVTALLAGCSTNANPFNWFGNDAPEQDNLTPIEESNPLIPDGDGGIFRASRAERERYKGVPIDSVIDVRTERVPGGLLIKARGLAATQGVHDARLTPANADEAPDENGVLTYRLEALNDPSQTTQGAQQTREVVVARKRTDQELEGTRVIRIQSATNAVETRR